MNEEFYIGYHDNMPKGVARFVKKTVILLFVGTLALVIVLALKQRGFLGSTYEYYQDIELTGYIISQPMPALQVNWGHDLYQNPLIQTIPIVAFGKIGGKALVEEFTNTRVTVSGKLIYYDGKALLELAGDSQIIPQEPVLSGAIPVPNIEYAMPAKFTGEIVDAKCFFGVMKPGHGKPHRSCAIRCISGGIPAVLRSKGKDGTSVYHLIINESHIELARYVGEAVEVTGTEGSFNDWKVLKMNNIIPVVALGNLENIHSANIAIFY